MNCDRLFVRSLLLPGVCGALLCSQAPPQQSTAVLTVAAEIATPLQLNADYLAKTPRRKIAVRVRGVAEAYIAGPQSEIHQLARSLATKSGEADYSTGEGVHPRASKEGRPEDCEPRTRHAAPRLPTWLPAGPAARRSGAVLPKSARGRAAERLPEPELYHKLLLNIARRTTATIGRCLSSGRRSTRLLPAFGWKGGGRIESRSQIAVPIYGDMAKFLAVQPRESEYLFARGSKPIRDFRARWNQACEEAGVPGLLFHDLRRTAVRNLRRAGVAESVIMKITGPRTRGIFDLTTSPTKATPRKPVALPKSYLPRNTIPAWHKSRHKIGRKPN
jgi:hypothetical protein